MFFSTVTILRMMTTSEFISRGCGANPFVEAPGFHVAMLANDWLHVIDLSLIPDSAASALLELTESPGELFEGSTQDQRLRSAFIQFRALCREHRIRIWSCIIHVRTCVSCEFPCVLRNPLRKQGPGLFCATGNI